MLRAQVLTGEMDTAHYWCRASGALARQNPMISAENTRYALTHASEPLQKF